MTKGPHPSPPLQRSLHRHIVAGAAASGFLCFGLIGWGAQADLAGAVIAHGQLVVESSAKKIQHPTGGVIRSISVADGQTVKAGEVLAVLDDTQTRASLAVVSQSLDELQGRRSRLEAERDGVSAIAFPAPLEERATHDNEVGKILAGERTLFEARIASRSGQKSQLAARIEQLQQDIEGLAAQQEAKAREIELVRTELASVDALYAKKLVPISRVSALRREAARLEGERGLVTSNIAEAKGKGAEIRLQILQIDQDLRTEVMRDLRETDAKIEEFLQRQIAARDQLARIELRSPQEGIVNGLSVHTVGGVIGAGETIMQIVPMHDRLIVEARVAPQDIDQIAIGQPTYVRLSAFNQRTTPELIGTVATISADLMHDSQPLGGPQQPYYTARVDLDERQIARLHGVKLVPGMPAEIHLQTGSRSALSYMLRPLTDQFGRAFREQ